ncbi:helix-turn-helix domain-containing protein [Arthrobacter sp. D1-29]
MEAKDKGLQINPRDGNQTLRRGLRVLLEVADSKDGLSVQQVSEMLGVHRSIAYRLLQTLADYRMVTRSRAGLYIPGARLATLAGTYLPNLRDVASPAMLALADRLQSTIALFVEEGEEVVAVSMVEPTTPVHHISFQPGMRTPLTLGAAGYAILAGGAPSADEPANVAVAREKGYARSHSEVEAGAFGVAAWIPMGGAGVRACLNLITHREDIADQAGPEMRRVADEVGHLLQQSG